MLGDWVVDDYWVTGIHRSRTASRTGRAHYRSLHQLEGTVRALCGAGRTATVLHDAKIPEMAPYNIIGLGVWHQDDDAAVGQLIGATADTGLNMYRLSVPSATSDSGTVVNLAPTIQSFLTHGGEQHLPHRSDYRGVGTTRMIRIFQNSGTRIELLERIDWELLPPFNQAEGCHAWFPDASLYANDGGNRSYRRAAQALEGELRKMHLPAQDVDAVVIKDLGKGVVSNATVRWLKSLVPSDIPWFVSSKSWRPKWLSEVPHERLVLLMVPQVAARSALELENVRRWLTDSGAPTLDAIRCVDSLYSDFKLRPEQAYVAVLPYHQQLLLRGPFSAEEGESSVDCIVQRLSEPVDLDFEVAMASVLLPALVAQLLNANDYHMTTAAVRHAASFTDTWMKREVERIEATEDPQQQERLRLELESTYSEAGEWQGHYWSTERREWEDALSDLGIVSDGRTRTIELARAMTALDGYVCLVDSKERVVQRLAREARRFGASHQRRHVSLLITASPGSGKSALIDAVVHAEGLTCYTINIAQLPRRIDVIDEFDTVATLQAQNRSVPLLVFVDEINAMLESQHVYDLFLSAMQNGEYLRGGKRFRLDPCLWVFAGTARPTERNTDADTKAPDFESRLSVAPMTLDAPDLKDADARHKKLDRQIRLERVYVGVSMLTTQFPDVRRVTRKILQLFHSLPMSSTLRDLVKLVSRFENVQLGSVHSGNVSRESFFQIDGFEAFDFDDWSHHEEGEFVKIVAR